MGSASDIFLQEFEELMGISLFSVVASEIPSMLISLAIYIFTGWALYTIAKRRGIHNPWLAWVPFGNSWLIGCISDQYRSVSRGEVKNRRKVLLITEILSAVIGAVVVVLCFGTLFEMMQIGFENLDGMSDAASMELMNTLLGSFAIILLLCLPLMVVSIVYMVFYYIALHDIYKSCDPGNATLYLVLSIFIGICRLVFLFLCRNKDDGMPQRQEPQPVYEIPQWQPMEPPVEPWQREE